ncbi:MAG: hypothetical protein IT341_10530 [Chloroflexi bacterium]|nr:hypothetical protein [Chloroflexota bacterium]
MADVPLMKNPMTAAGDIIQGGASGAPSRLAIGTAGQILKVNSGATALEYAPSGGGGLTIPDLLNSPAPAGGCDAEFAGSISPFTAVDGSSGTASLMAGSGAGIYDVATRAGWLLMMIGTSSGDSVELKQDYTLPDGKCIVTYISTAFDLPSTNNESHIGIAVNDNDGRPYAGTTGQTIGVHLDTETSNQIRLIGWDGSNVLGETGTGMTAMSGWFLRIDRSGLIYRAFASRDGFSWSFIGAKTMSTAANNVWLFATCAATMGNRTTIAVPWFREGTALAIDPFPLSA